MAYDFDLLTLGAGSGGVAGSRRAASYGAKVGIIEAGRVGGTCVLRGCVPKKLLVYAAHFADDFRDAAGYGWTVGQTGFDWPTLIANKDRELDRLEGIYRKLLSDSGVQTIAGRGRVLDAHTVGLDDGRTVTAERILIATGGQITMPQIPGIDLAIGSDQALSLPTLPRRVLVVGGGYIAVEFAGIFRNLGVETTLALRGDGVLRGFDQDVRDHLGTEMTERGITIKTHTEIARIDRGPDGLVATTKTGDRLVADVILYATGRKPNSGGLGLDALGIPLGPTGAIPVDDWNRTVVPSVYAIGDVTDRINLTPVAIGEGRAMAETLYNNNPIRFDHTLIATAVFSLPTVSTVGLTEAEARAAYPAVDIYRSRFRPMKHTLSGRAEKTLMKLVVDRATDRVLGCHMVGADAPEIIQGLAVALKCGATKRQFDATVGIHPTAAEEFVTMRDKVPDPV